MIKTSAPGKLTLFGEHAVIYGEPAIATALDKRAFVIATALDERKIILKSKNLEGIIEASIREKTDNPAIKAAQVALEKAKSSSGVEININSDIPVAIGMGSSASISVATAAAVLKLFSSEQKVPTKLEILEVAHEAEKVIHGNHSGIDIATATFGGTIFFKKGEAEGLEAPELQLIVGNTRVARNTQEIVKGVKKIIEDPRVAYNLFTIGSIVKRAREAILRNSIAEIGFLMDKNQQFLRNMGVSSIELEELIQIAKNSGAQGAKLTGAGAGGCMIALSDNPEKIKKAFDQHNAEAFIVRTNQEGVRFETT